MQSSLKSIKGQILHQLKRSDEALFVLEKAIKINPKSQENFIRKGEQSINFLILHILRAISYVNFQILRAI